MEAAENSPVNTRQAFREAKMAQLGEERAVREAAEPPAATAQALDEEVPSPEAESADVPLDPSQEGYADEEDDQGLLEGSPEDLDEEAPSGEDQELAEDTVDWEKRYKDLQSETQQIFESRGEMEQEHGQAMQAAVDLKFQLEDELGQARQMAEFYYNTLTGNAAQFENINWANVPADKVQEVQAQAQQAFLLKQQAEQAYKQAVAYENQVKERQQEREAALAKIRLKRSIPGWGNEVYGQLREFAEGKGLGAQEFNQITNPVIIEALHAYRQLSEPASEVKTRTTRKAPTPRGKAARRQPRDERGKFASKRVEPNVRGSFADKHRHRLAMERQGRG